MIQQGLLKLITVAPERFFENEAQKLRRTAQQLLGIPYDLFVIDEAHCIDKWGRNFRPAYTKLSEVRKAIHNPPTIALTASASAAVQKRILKSLNLEDAKVFVTGFYRPEITLGVKHVRTWREYKGNSLDEEKVAIIVDLLNKYHAQKVIIYVVTVNQGEALIKRSPVAFKTWHSITEKYLLRRN